MINWIKKQYCKQFHKQITLPFEGKYICLKCQMEHEVDWPAFFVYNKEVK